MKSIIVLLCALLAVANSQYLGRVILPTTPGVSYIQVMSPWYLIELTEPPIVPFTLTLTSTALDIAFTPATLNFDPTTQSATFRFITKNTGTYLVTPVLDAAGETQYSAPFAFAVVSRLRLASLDSFVTSINVNYPTEPIKIQLSHPSTGDLDFTPSSDDGTLRFSPSTITIPAGSIAGSFSFTPTKNLESNFSLVSWTASGNEVGLYSNLTMFEVTTNTREIMLPDLPQRTVVGFNSTLLYAYTPDYANTTVTITPFAPDTVFVPPVLQFTPSVRVVNFTMITQTPEVGKSVYYYIGGSGQSDYESITVATFTVQTRSFVVQAPTSYVLRKDTLLSIRVGAPLDQPVIVTFFAANLEFSPNNVTFSANTTSQTVVVTPTSVGPDVITFLVTGAEKDLYITPTPVSLSVSGGHFIGPADWYVPSLWVGVPSPKIPVRVNIKPYTNVTLTPVCPDMVFSPSTLTFTSSTMQQYFTMTPHFTNAAIDTQTVSTSTVQFIVGGDDLFSFSAPAQVPVSVYRRSTQVQWSAQIFDVSSYKTLYLKKQYIAWASINYPSSLGLHITPVSPFATFEPAVLNFGTGVTDIKFVVTVEAAVGYTSIDYIIGGPDAGYYTTPTSDQILTALRPLTIHQVVMSPDTRSPYGAVFDNPLPTYLVQNHVYSFSLKSPATPGSLTITPRSHNIDFNPASIVVNSGALKTNIVEKQTTPYSYFPTDEPFVTANFSVSAKSAGVHEVWVELSGPDADYYDVTSNFYLRFNIESLAVGDGPSNLVSSGSQLKFSGTILFVAMLFFYIM